MCERTLDDLEEKGILSAEQSNDIGLHDIFGADLSDIEVTDLAIHEMLHLRADSVMSSRARPGADEAIRFEVLTRSGEDTPNDEDTPTSLASATLR